MMKRIKKKSKTKKKIGLFGGSFNPIQNGHLKIIRSLIKNRLVDKVWVMPCKKHAFNKNLLSDKHRVNMIKLSIKNLKNAKICHIELKSKTTNYTLNTLKKLKARYPYEFFLINGSDIFKEIKKWNNYQQLLKEAEFIIFRRNNYPIKKIKNLKFHLVNENEDKISSTEVRKRVKEGKSLKNLIPLSVEGYIKANKLYLK